jgi:hypothetical protein
MSVSRWHRDCRIKSQYRRLRLTSFACFLTINAFLATAAAHAAPVTWRFYETSIVSCNNSGFPIACALPPQPFVLMTLRLSGCTSTGTTTWVGTGSQPIYTGDSFTLTVPFTRPLRPPFAGDASNPRGVPCSSGGRSTICDLNISWSETAGDLTLVVFNIDGVNDSVGGLAGGALLS